MVRKKETEVIDKKDKNAIKKEILEEINEDVKKEICASVVEDIKLTLSKDYIKELKESLRSEVVSDARETIKKEQSKIIRRKNFKIFRLYIYIIVLLVSCIFLIYNLYKTGNLEVLDKYLHLNKIVDVKKDEGNKNNDKTEDYAAKYKDLVNVLKISDASFISESITMDKIDMGKKIALAFNNVLDKVEIDGMIYSIKSDVIKDEYNKLFMTNDYKETTFIANGLTFAYSNSTNMYMAIGNMEDSRYLNNDVKEASVSDGKVTLKCNTYYEIDGYIYSLDMTNLGKVENINELNIETIKYVFDIDNKKIVEIIKE